MTHPGAPRRGRHSSGDGADAAPAAWSGGQAGDGVEGNRSATSHRDTPGDTGRMQRPAGAPGPRWAPPGASYGPTAGRRRRSGLLDPGGEPDLDGGVGGTGPVARHGDPSAGGSAEPPRPPSGPDGGPRQTPWPAGGYLPEPGRHPSAPLPPRPAGVWNRLHRAGDAGDREDAPTEARPMPADPPPPVPAVGRRNRPDASGAPRDPHPEHDAGDEPHTDAHAPDWQDRTGGLEVIGDHVDGGHWWNRGRRRGAVPADDGHSDDGHSDDGQVDDGSSVDGDFVDGDFVDEQHHAGPHDDQPRYAGQRRRRHRRPLGVIVVLLLLAGVAAGVVVGGKTLLDVLNPVAEDFSGSGTGSVEVRIDGGDTLSDIARTLVDAGVIASTEPFVDAAEDNAAATGIQPGVYGMRERMSGQAALDLLLEPGTRLVSQVTVPEGFTVADTLQRLADSTGVPLADVQAAAADPAGLGLPDYAGGQLEGYLFPATYEFEPGTAPADMLRRMVRQFTQVGQRLELEQRSAQLGLSPAEVVTVASMVESETRLDEERPDVAQVIYNRLEQGMPLGIDATLAYGLDKNGNELTREDLSTDSPYNTRTRQGLPPTPISAPGEASLEAALTPSSGDLLYYVLESEDGSHFFTDDFAEFQAAVQRCAAAGLGCGG